MNRAEIKRKAKEMIRGNKWYIWKPSIIFALCIGLITGVAYGLDTLLGLSKEFTYEIGGQTTTIQFGGYISSIASIFTSFVSCAFAVGYSMYILSFVRGKKLELKDILEFMKKNWVISFIVSLIAELIIFGCTLLLVIPGIIASIGLMFYKEVCADNPKLYFKEILKKSWQMTKGHKMELFIFILSFLGWFLLAGFTFGILYIWLIPYITVSTTLVYEQLKKTS